MILLSCEKRYKLFSCPAKALKSMVIALAKYTGWGLAELNALTEDELIEWFEAALDHKQATEAG